MTAVVWFRDDLRVGDNPALTAAMARGTRVVAVYVLDEVSPGVRPLGGAARWWLHQSLQSLRASLERIGVPLVLRRGAAEAVLPAVATEAAADAVFWNRRYGRAERTVDAALKLGLRAAGLHVQSHAASLLYEPWTLMTGAGQPYSVFTPFWRRASSMPEPRRPLPAPERPAGSLQSAAVQSPPVQSEPLDSWGLQPSAPDWAGGLRAAWRPGEQGALDLLAEFLDEKLPLYPEQRDEPAEDVTSRLSPALRWGEISPHTVWHETMRVRAAAASGRIGSEGAASTFLRQLGWREFAAHVSFHAPDLHRVNWRREFDAFEWPPLDQGALTAWQRGQTGVPLVDAGMRELWATGTMHNRVRMVVASYLSKNLLIDWRHGEEWFWQTLVDADAASNPFNWQWVAGSGADAAPYFRVFNPVLQQQKFDPHGSYVRRHVPEWGTPEYPEPLVDLGESRRAALAAYDRVKHAKYSAPAPA
ncbi:cryptochrome/photolyase family protein [Microterricola viridarii]|uniref:Deoxyribodipyrimidine photo-lyase type I n=1 Tax=Microterricola viridarii TaxID=412690 RepID=A0A1H1ZLU8_9MICO|nr:deoxyribodipyrimidine photo-lyase [Microterricola viridarii]SDT34557.1 deoxyribodipyrimidine photo-lyase type I [Microterricola viridarii]